THLPPLRRQRRDLPRALAAGIDRALRPRSAERGTVADLRAALVQSLPDAGDERGVVVSGWQFTPTELDDRPIGGRWRDGARQPPVDRNAGVPAAPRRIGGHAIGPPPAWLERGLLAGATGLSAGWLSAHLSAHLHGIHQPLAPAAVALLAALATLLL